MFSERLNIALERGLVTLPESGRIAVIGVRAGDDLSALPKERTQLVTRFFPDHSAQAARGYDVAVAPSGRYALAFVILPRARSEARDVLALAARVTDGPIVIDGQKTDGIDGLLREVKARATVGEVLSKAHGKIAVAEGLAAGDWAHTQGALIEGRFQTAPGVFSADGVDPGSRMLADALPSTLDGRVVDLGAGWGYLAAAVLTRAKVQAVDLVEADLTALDMARLNVTDERAVFHWADARDFTPDASVDHVVMNPPFHTGRAVDASLGQAFIRQAAAILKPRGSLWLVANRHLPYEAVLKDAFAETRVLDENSSYKLFHATSPRRPRKG